MSVYRWMTSTSSQPPSVHLLSLALVVVSLVTSLLALVIALFSLVLSIVRMMGTIVTVSKTVTRQRYIRVAITGASGGIGEALALEFCRRYDNVILSLSGRNMAKLNAVKEKCESLGASAVTCCSVDVRNKGDVSAWLLKEDDQQYDNFGPIDVIVANSGVSSATLSEGCGGGVEGAVREMIDVNTMGAVNTIFPLLSRFQRRRSGQICIISSLSGIGAGKPRSFGYNASKAAIMHIGIGLRQILKQYNIKVNVVCPGYVETNMVAAGRRQGRHPWNVATPEAAARRICDGLQWDEGVMLYPPSTSLLAWSVAQLSPPSFEAVCEISGADKCDWTVAG